MKDKMNWRVRAAKEVAKDLSLKFRVEERTISVFFQIEGFNFAYKAQGGQVGVSTAYGNIWCEGANGRMVFELYERGDILSSLLQAMVSAKELVRQCKIDEHIFQCSDCGGSFVYPDVLVRGDEEVCDRCLVGYTPEEQDCFVAV